MKSLVESILNSTINESRMHVQMVTGIRHMNAANKEYGVNIKESHDDWRVAKSVRTSYGPTTFYWSHKCEWIFYYIDKEHSWAAVSPAVGMKNFEISMLMNFEQLLMDGATIPEFDSVDTTLE